MDKIDFVNSTQPALNDTNLNLMQDNIERAINAQVSGDTLPIGSIIPFAPTTIPENWLLCDGRAVSRTTYSQLFNVIGTTYGVGDGSTTFNLPDMKGRVPVGYDVSQTEFNTTGKTGGEKTHTLTVSEMPSHSHNTNIGSALSTASGGYRASDSGVVQIQDNISRESTSTGGGEAHNNLQPYLVARFIIKANQTAGTVAQILNIYSTSTVNGYSASLINGTPLYINTQEISEGSFVLNTNNIQDYKRLKFFDGDGISLGEIEIANASQFGLMLADQGASSTYFKVARLTISGTTITIVNNKRLYYNGSTMVLDNTGLSIAKVIGYKY